MHDEPLPRSQGGRRWDDAVLVANLAARFPDLVRAIHVISGAGPVRDQWIDVLDSVIEPSRVRVRVPNSVSLARLTGGVDVEASLLAGHTVRQVGILDRVRGGMMVLPMAERFPRSLAALVANALDDGPEHSQPPFLLVALDESENDDAVMADVLKDRMTMTVRLDGISIHDVAAGAKTPDPRSGRLPEARVPDDILRALAELTGAMPNGGIRMLNSMARVCRAVATWAGRDVAIPEDAAKAVSLCLGVDVTMPESAPQSESKEVEDQPPREASQETLPDGRAEEGDKKETDDNSDLPDPADLGDLVLDAVKASAAIQNLLAGKSGQHVRAGAQSGSAGAAQSTGRRGRPTGMLSRPPRPDAKPNVIATLQAAIPFQRLRMPRTARATAVPGARIRVLPTDFRYQRHKHPTESAAIFAVDASGSTALSRLAEAKGAIELLLADCYVRRDTVALVSFRGLEANTLLEPTRSLVRAKRSLAQLPGGGATPLADAIRLSMDLADTVKRRGQSPLIVLLTDGSGNIALDRRPDRAQAHRDACNLAALANAKGYRSILIDIGARPRAASRDLAMAMNAEYHPLPHVSAQAVSTIVERHLRG